MASFVLLGVNAIDGTSVYAGGVLGADTGFSDHVCHLGYLRGSKVFSTLIVAHGPKRLPRLRLRHFAMREREIYDIKSLRIRSCHMSKTTAQPATFSAALRTAHSSGVIMGASARPANMSWNIPTSSL